MADNLVTYRFRAVGYIGTAQYQTIFYGYVQAPPGYPWEAYQGAIAQVKKDEPTVRVAKELPKACTLRQLRKKP